MVYFRIDKADLNVDKLHIHNLRLCYIVVDLFHNLWLQFQESKFSVMHTKILLKFLHH